MWPVPRESGAVSSRDKRGSVDTVVAKNATMGEVQYIFQGYDGDMEPLYRVHEAQGIMDNMYSVLRAIIVYMYCGKRSGLSGSQLGKRTTHTTNNNQAHLRIAVKPSIIVIETLSLESDQIKM